MWVSIIHGQSFIEANYVPSFRYEMMMKCWESSPKERPSFNALYKEVTKFIERVAGYLDVGYNPFTKRNALLRKGTVKDNEKYYTHYKATELW